MSTDTDTQSANRWHVISTEGIMALLHRAYSGEHPDEIMLNDLLRYHAEQEDKE